MGLFKKKDKGSVKVRGAGAMKTMGSYLEAAGADYKYENELASYVVWSKGDDLPILTMISADDDWIRINCPLPFKAVPDNFGKVLNQLNLINSNIELGSFSLLLNDDEDNDQGTIIYGYSLPCAGTDLSADFFVYLLNKIIGTMDKYDGDLKELAETIPESDYRAMYF